MADLFSSNVLTAVVNSLLTNPTLFLLNAFFSTTQTETSEEIHFDVEDDVMGLAPFVSPVVEGQVMTEHGFTTKTFKPAYIKPKRAFDASRALKRSAGEPIGGNLSPEQRIQRLVANHLMYDRTSIDRRLEWMASSVLRTGAVTISGDKYQTTSVSFGRDAALTITLGAGSKWSDAGIKPLDNLQTWADLIVQKSGSRAGNVIMDLDAWKVFRADASVEKRLDIQRAMTQTPSMTQDAARRGPIRQGSVDGFDIWTYQEYYKAESNGAITPFLPSGTVLMVGDIQGVQAFGAIQDMESLQAVQYFSKSWLENDPSRRFIMTQSAPLVVPYRPNASLCATVL